jgi:DNA primase
MTARDPVWEEFKDRALAVAIDEVASRLATKLRRAGPDLLGHCPAGCTIHGDGLIVTPRKGIFLCRPSGTTGDVIDMVEHAEGLAFAAACEFITGELVLYEVVRRALPEA